MAKWCIFDKEDIYDNKVVGLYAPLQVDESDESVTVAGELFTYAISKQTGQVSSAKVLDTEYLAQGAQFPNPYIGLFPEDDPGAEVLGNPRAAKYGFEKASKIDPPLYSRDLTNSPVRYDAHDSTDVTVSVLEASPGLVRISARGRFANQGQAAGVSWQITYAVDVDSFMRVDVEIIPEKPVLLQWHCFLQTSIERSVTEFMVPWLDKAMVDILGFRLMPSVYLEGRSQGELLYGASLNPYLHFGNPKTGIEFTKERFEQRMTGYRDSSVVIDGVENQFDAAKEQDGQLKLGADSRGRRQHMTQVYLQENGIEIEDFDIRNTTCPLNSGEKRHRYFFVQMTPPKLPKEDLNGTRLAWPGPHQIRMVGWSQEEEWEPPKDAQIEEWESMHINLLVGGANYFDGDTPSLVKQDKVREFLKKAHDAGMKVIPYMTFADFEFGARDYRKQGGKWYNSRCIEFKNETLLMCSGSEEWRNHFEAQAEWLLSNFDFDGLYIDHWGLRQCDNGEHGCDGRPFQFVTEGYHDIAKRARRVVSRHTDGKGVMLMNGGGGCATFCAAMFDLGLLGENVDMRKVPERELLSTINPERSGCRALVYPSGYGHTNAFFNFAAAAGFPFNARLEKNCVAGPKDAADRGRPLGTSLWKIHAEFGTEHAMKVSTFARDNILDITGKGAQVNAYCRDGQLLLMGGRLQSAQIPDIDPEALGVNIRTAILDAGLIDYVADDIVFRLKPLFKPTGTIDTGDDLEGAKRKDFLYGSSQDSKDSDQGERVIIKLLDWERLGMASGKQYQLTDLLGKANPGELKEDSFEIDLVEDYPFAVLLSPAGG